MKQPPPPVLETLVIQDFLLIERLTLSLDTGLSVFTGETGAGKSILLDALGLALGARSEAGLIRKGANQALVAAHFSTPLPNEVAELLRDQGIEAEDSLILRRVIGSDGKSRAFVNDMPVGVAFLRRLGEALLEVHGQFETHGLLDPATHRAHLDAFGGLGGDVATVAAAYRRWRDARKALADARAEAGKAKAEEEYLRSAVAELRTLAPREGEIDALAASRSTLQNREKITEALRLALVSAGDKGASSSLAQAGKALARIADKDPSIAPLLLAVDQAAALADEAAAAIERRLHDLDEGPHSLESIEERLFALRGVARKHGCDPAHLPELQDDLSRRLGLLEDKGSTLQALANAEAEARTAYLALARKLSVARKAAAGALTKKLGAELPPLKLEKARFVVEIESPDSGESPDSSESGDSGESGLDHVTFLIATNPGSEPGPLHKIASGGELARFMLALKVVLSSLSSVGTLVFDEVDTGISGATASAVGTRLARLSENLQVLVVTHSPQVAARGTAHYRVEKESKAGKTTTRIERLDDSSRIEEIARLLAGETTTKAARDAAKSLLEDKEAPPAKKNARKKAI